MFDLAWWDDLIHLGVLLPNEPHRIPIWANIGHDALRDELGQDATTRREKKNCE